MVSSKPVLCTNCSSTQLLRTAQPPTPAAQVLIEMVVPRVWVRVTLQPSFKLAAQKSVYRLQQLNHPTG